MNTTPQEMRVLTVTRLWTDLLPFNPPEAYTLNLWVLSHGVETVFYAVKETGLKRVRLNGDFSRDHAIRLCSAICCSVTREKKHLATKEPVNSITENKSNGIQK
jgi:hypothetical protein